MKRLTALIVAICLLLCGCGVIRDTGETGANVPVSELNMQDQQYAGRVQKSAVYFLNKASEPKTLTAEIRTLIVEQDANPAETAVAHLLDGPILNADELKGVAPLGMKLDFIEFSRDVANVYLIYNGNPIPNKDKFILELAIANTVKDVLGASYISVFYNGIQTGFSGYASAPHKKQTGSIEEAWLQASGKYLPDVPAVVDEAAENTDEVALATPAPDDEEEQEETDDTEPDTEAEEAEPKSREIATVLYFVSANGEYILPEVRNITYTDDNYVESIVRELKKGPQDNVTMQSPLTDDLALNSEPVLQETDSGYKMTLDFSKLPTLHDFSGTEEAMLSYAALIYTVTGLVPGISSVELTVNGQQIPDVQNDIWFRDGMQRSDFIGYIGSSIPIYLEHKPSDLLLEVSRSMEQRKTWSAKARVLKVFEGPLPAGEEDADAVMITGMTEDDILSVDVYGDTAYIDLSANFKALCSDLSGRNEMLLVYSIVNTITAMDGVNSVQFLVEGEQTTTLAGTLCISDPFLKNYGIIKESS